ncbi:MAG: hypothetical protein Q8P57_01895 [Candidatus Pacearchaeota archaeon]|nr:hypothetical protein [Candidatus Pacearchaeota archaeon]
MSLGKRGQKLLGGTIIVILLVLFGLPGLLSVIGNGDYKTNFDAMISVAEDTVIPIFSFLLGLDKIPDNNIQFLVVLAFIMISIIIVSTLDSINIFGEGTSRWVNFVVGIIVSLIGVRFMPENMWESLTAPSSAFVATMLVGLPFLATVFVTMKIKFDLVRKIIWLFFLIVLGYIIYVQSGSGFEWVYVIFAGLAGFMMIFDASVRKYFYKQKSDLEIETMLGKLSLKKRKIIRDEIKKYYDIIADPDTPHDEKGRAAKTLVDLEKQLRKLRTD